MLSSYWSRTGSPGLLLVFWRKMLEKGLTYLESMYVHTTWMRGITKRELLRWRSPRFWHAWSAIWTSKASHFFWVSENELVSGLSHNTNEHELLRNEPISLPSLGKYVQRLAAVAPPNTTKFSIYHQLWQRNPYCTQIRSRLLASGLRWILPLEQDNSGH